MRTKALKALEMVGFFFHSKSIKYHLKPQILGFIYPGLNNNPWLKTGMKCTWNTNGNKLKFKNLINKTDKFVRFTDLLLQLKFF